MNNIIVRTLSGAVFVSLILISLWFSQELAAGVFSVFMLLGLIEFYRLFDKSETIAINWKVASAIGFFIFALIAGVIFDLLMPLLLVFILPLVFLLFTGEIWRKKKNPLLNVAVLGMGHIYVILPFLLIIYLIKNDDSSFPLLAGMFILIWMNDTFAFLSGKFFGKKKLIERISPNKTWEGTIGGVLFTLLAGVAIGLLFDTDNLVFWIISATIIAPCAVVGDLLESLFKRNAEVKDSGSIMPGHGGILDRFDATLLAMPIFFAWVVVYKFFC
ncbi:MAG: phosphatidate cytidylyltransferase [Fluviicola sp.]|nr:phosphatidate cytidylyltransferase [Fluviicola sp.]